MTIHKDQAKTRKPTRGKRSKRLKKSIPWRGAVVDPPVPYGAVEK